MSIPSSPRAVVTGAGGGLGRAFALELAKDRGRVLVSDIDEQRARETADMCRAMGVDAFAMRCDVSRFADVEALAKAAEERFGGCDLIVNNAGVAVGGEVGEVSLDDWNWIVSINLMGVVHGCHTFVPRLRAQRAGHVINVASAAGLIANASMAPYNATKFAVVGMSEAMFQELREHGVGVTVVCPTFFQTGILDAGRGTDDDLKAVAAKLMKESKLDANDVARAALDAAAKGKLYCVPMTDGRSLWAIKRMAPEAYSRLTPRVMKMIRGRVKP